MPAIGIDLGTTNCCVAVWKEHADTDEDDRVEIIVNDLGKRVTPSYVAFTSTERIVGAPAKDQARHNLKNTVHSVKRLIGRKFSDTVVQDDITGWPFHVVRGPQGDPTIRVKQGSTAMQLAPQQISAVLLEKMKAIAEEFMDEEITQAVITVPAYFTDHQRCATIEAAEKAGLELLRIINEPMAAALTYGLDSTLHSESTVLIFDLGGGTCDVCILRIGDGSFEVIAVKGDTHLGGEDIDKRLVEHMLQVISERHGLDLSGNPKSRSRLHAVAEQAKHTLSANSVAHIDVDSLLEGGDFQTKITRATLEHTCADLFDRAKALVTSCLEDAGLEAEDIDEVVLVGGSTRIPKVQSLLRQVFPGKALNKRINPDEAVAYGAAVQAAMLAERRPRQLRQLAVQDVTPLSLGIGLHNDTVAVVIPKNSPTPASVTRHNFVIPTGCAGVAIPVYEGEERVAHKSSFLGEFALVGLPKSSTGSNQVEVTFEIDVNGILAVKAMHRGSGKWRQVTVTHGNHGVSGDA